MGADDWLTVCMKCSQNGESRCICPTGICRTCHKLPCECPVLPVESKLFGELPPVRLQSFAQQAATIIETAWLNRGAPVAPMKVMFSGTFDDCRAQARRFGGGDEDAEKLGKIRALLEAWADKQPGTFVTALDLIRSIIFTVRT